MANQRRLPKVVLSPEARRDLRDALIWSEMRFGPDARLRYEALIVQAIRDIQSEPTRHGSTERPELMKKGVRTYHIRLSRNRAKTAVGVVHDPRHFVLYRHREDGNAIEIGRILHDSRDLYRHIPEEFQRGKGGSSE